MKYISNIIRAMMCVILSGCLSLDERLASSDYSTRKDAEYELYANAAKTGDEKSTIDAVNRLTCDEVLADIAISGKSQNVRAIAATKIRDNRSLYSVVTKSTDCKIKVVAINNMTDQAMILSVYNEQTEEPVKLAAIGRMDSATTAKLPYSSMLAKRWQDISSQEVLKTIIENDLLKVPQSEWTGLLSKITDEKLKQDVQWSLAFVYATNSDSLPDEAKRIILDNISQGDIIEKMITPIHGVTDEEFKDRRKIDFAECAAAEQAIAKYKGEQDLLMGRKKEAKSAFEGNRLNKRIQEIQERIDHARNVVKRLGNRRNFVYVPDVDARVSLYAKASDKTLSDVLDKKMDTLRHFYSSDIDQWEECATLISKIRAQDVKAAKYIKLLVKIADERDKDEKRNSWNQDWNAETKVKARQFFDSWDLKSQPVILERLLTDGGSGSIDMVRYASSDMLRRLWMAHKLKRPVQAVAAKRIDASDIDMALYNTASDDDAKKILFSRMPDACKNEAKIANEQLVSAILETANAKSSETFSMKGFYLGMPIEDAKFLLQHYFPESKIDVVGVSGGGNAIEIDVKHSIDFDVTPMYFCRANSSGAVYLFNFDSARFLSKWFDYDVQDYREWAIAYGRDNGCDFRAKTVSERNDHGDVWIQVSQEVFQYKNNKKKYMISVFGEKDVFDPNRDLTDAELMGGMFGGNTDAMYRFGLIEGVRLWVKNGWENDKGAREGTLRVQELE